MVLEKEVREEMMRQLGLFDEGKYVQAEPLVMAAMIGESQDIFPEILRLHVRPDATIADVTWGLGVFWRRVEVDKYRVLKSDLVPRHGASLAADMGRLPYPSGSVDVIVIDPPFQPRGGRSSRYDYHEKYGTNVGGLKTQADVEGLYFQAIHEAKRVLKGGGKAVVKCQDAVESRRQWWTHISVYTAARAIGMEALDLFVLVRTGGSANSYPERRQAHARKNLSYFWVFQKI